MAFHPPRYDYNDFRLLVRFPTALVPPTTDVYAIATGRTLDGGLNLEEASRFAGYSGVTLSKLYRKSDDAFVSKAVAVAKREWEAIMGDEPVGFSTRVTACKSYEDRVARHSFRTREGILGSVVVNLGGTRLLSLSRRPTEKGTRRDGLRDVLCGVRMENGDGLVFTPKANSVFEIALENGLTTEVTPLQQTNPKLPYNAFVEVSVYPVEE